MQTPVAAHGVADDRRSAQHGGVLAAVAQDFDLGGRFGLSIKIERLRLVGGLIVAGDAVEDRVGGKVDEFRTQVETELRQLLRDFRVEHLGAGGVGLAGFDRRKGGAMDDGVRELFEHEGFERGLGAEIEGAGLRYARYHGRAGAA